MEKEEGKKMELQDEQVAQIAGGVDVTGSSTFVCNNCGKTFTSLIEQQQHFFVCMTQNGESMGESLLTFKKRHGGQVV